MTDYTQLLPEHGVKKIGEHDLHLEIFKGTPPHDEKQRSRSPHCCSFTVHTQAAGCGANISPTLSSTVGPVMS